MTSPGFKNFLSPAALTGAAFCAVVGLLLWSPLGQAWENVSYDCLFRFGSRPPKVPVVIVQMQNQDDDFARQRAEHTTLLNKLHADGARLVVFDVLFSSNTSEEIDSRFAQAIRENGHVILTAFLTNPNLPDSKTVETASLELPQKRFLDAAAGYGIGHVDAPTTQVVRRHWPFESPGDDHFRSLGRAAAEVFSGSPLDKRIQHQWLRYYGEHGPGEMMSYAAALGKPPGEFRDKVIFIGGWPKATRDPGASEPDKFCTPYTYSLSGGEAVGGVLVNATTFLNLVNKDWLRRAPAFVEIGLLLISSLLLGGGLLRLKPLHLLIAVVVIFAALFFGFALFSYWTNFWFPWLVIAGGQLPVAFIYGLFAGRPVRLISERHPGYVEISGSFGEGSFGNVRVVRNATGQLQALKEVVRAKFLERHGNADAYEREFEGVKNYKPISAQHPGLLHIDYVNRNDEDGFYFYVMELGDAMDSGWEKNQRPYKPRDLHNYYQNMADRRLPVRETVRIGIGLLEALDFLHRLGLAHGDIKPANIIFVNDRPKLADVGLVRDVNAGSTFSGTPGFMPLPPEPNGTRAADIYAMGKVLYVISTGEKPETFSSLSTTLVHDPEFMLLNEIFCRACHPVALERYTDAGEMLRALRAVQDELAGGTTRRL